MDKQLLFEQKLDEDDVELPGIGTVRVRALTRHEVVAGQRRAGEGNWGAFERIMLSAGMVDPELTEAEVGRWQKAAPAGQLEPVSQRIQELSGLTEGAPKSGVADDGDGPGD